MRKKPKVLFLSNIPSPYVIGYLNELGRYCDVKAVFEKAADRTRPDSWKNGIRGAVNFRLEMLRGISVSASLYGCKMGPAPDDKAFSPGVIRHITGQYDMIIVGNPCTPTGIWEILYMRLYGIPYTIQSEGGFPGSGKGLKERFKHFLMKKAVLYFSTCELDDRYFYQYGATPDRIRRYIFTSMYEKDMPVGEISEGEKETYRRNIGADGKKMILTVGRSVPIKGFDILLRAFAGIDEHNARGDECCLYLVGADCVPEYQSIIDAEHLTNVKFISNVGFEELKAYYYAADVFVLPTRGDTWGLVINEAMAYGLPVVTTDMCVAGDALVEDGVNGSIVPVENVDALHETLANLIADPELCRKMGERNRVKLRGYTLEKMGAGMYGHISQYVK